MCSAKMVQALQKQMAWPVKNCQLFVDEVLKSANFVPYTAVSSMHDLVQSFKGLLEQGRWQVLLDEADAAPSAQEISQVWPLGCDALLVCSQYSSCTRANSIVLTRLPWRKRPKISCSTLRALVFCAMIPTASRLVPLFASILGRCTHHGVGLKSKMQ